MTATALRRVSTVASRPDVYGKSCCSVRASSILCSMNQATVNAAAGFPYVISRPVCPSTAYKYAGASTIVKKVSAPLSMDRLLLSCLKVLMFA